jgi:hypothetical protein
LLPDDNILVIHTFHSYCQSLVYRPTLSTFLTVSIPLSVASAYLECPDESRNSIKHCSTAFLLACLSNMLQPHVLPSNASPLMTVTESTIRVLQEQSGNRQYSDLKFTQNYKELLSENSHPRQITRATHQLYRPQLTSHAPFRTGFARPSYARSHHPTQAEKDDKARRLLRRFHSSEQYAKYRAKGGKEDGKNEEKKWPDHLEQAFFRGKSLDWLI